MNRSERRRQKKFKRDSIQHAASRKSPISFQNAIEYWNAGKSQQTFDTCAELLRSQPDHVEALNLTGVVLADAGRNDEAVLYFNKAIKLTPKNASFLFNLADAQHALGSLSPAEKSYNSVLEIDPRHSRALAGLGRISEQQGKPDAAIGYYRTALEVAPPGMEALCGIARTLGQQGRNEEAVGYIRRAIKAAPKLADAQDQIFDALRAGTAKQIPAWHFSMLADEERNLAYQKAIRKLVDQTSNVLEIGTGSGLLALMAAEAGAAHVTACEMAASVAEAAAHVVAKNGYSDVVDVVAKPSTALRIGIDLPERANVLISEILDSGLTGEGVVKFVRHAKRSLLTKNARILPARADVIAVLLTLPRLRPVNPLTTICGFDLSPFGRFQNLYDYQSIDLKREPNNRLSAEFDVETFDFNDLPEESSIENPHQKTFEVEATSDGTLHAIAYWFDLHLDDEIAVSSGPEGDVVHWGQAVQFFEDDLELRKGDIVRLNMHFDEIKIRWSLDEIISR